MSAALRSFIKSAWVIAHPDAPVYVGDPAVPDNSFLASPVDYANLEGESGKSYPMCMVWNIKRMPQFSTSGSGYMDNMYRVQMYVLDKCKPTDAFSALQSIMDALRPSVDKLLSAMHNNSVDGIKDIMVEECAPVFDDHACGHQISFRIWIDETSTTICQAPALIEP